MPKQEIEQQPRKDETDQYSKDIIQEIEKGSIEQEKVLDEIEQKKTKMTFFVFLALALSLIGFLGCLAFAIIGDINHDTTLYWQSPPYNRMLYFTSGFSIYGILKSIENIKNIKINRSLT